MKFVKSYANLEGSVWAYLYEDGSLSIELPTTKNIVLSPAGVKELCDVLEVKDGVQSPPEQKGCICFVNQHGVIVRVNPECRAHPSGGLTRRAADALPCGHNQGFEFGESSWLCAVCGQPVRR